MRDKRRRAAHHDRGQAGVLVIGLFLVALSFLGLAFDVARPFAERASLQARADEAALAATSGVDEMALGRDQVRLRGPDADARARSLLARAGLDPSVRVEVAVHPDRVEVRLHREIRAVFLQLVGVREIGVSARGTAAARPARP